MRARPSAALLLLLAAACGSGPAMRDAGPPDLVVVTFDTTRHDAPGFAGNPGARTPTLDALAAGGLTFTRAYASTAVTLPSHATLLTGLAPPAHGVRANGRKAVPRAAATLAERLSAHGYESAAFVAAWVLAPAFGLDQGFDTYGYETRPSGGHPLDVSVPQRPAGEVTDAALAWLAGSPHPTPLFLFVHYYDPHLPRDLGPGDDPGLAPYDAEVARADAALGRLLAGLDAARPGRPQLVVFTSDHGEAFGAHGEATHALLAYDATLHVPLVLAGPGVPAGATSDAFAQHVDLVPTVLALLGLPADPTLEGRDLVAAADARGFGWFESHSPALSLGWAPLEGVRDARWKYTATPAPAELYDLEDDPEEARNLADARPEVAARMRSAWQERHDRFPAPDAPGARLPPDAAEQLAVLGYAEVRGRFDERPDPRRWTRAHGLVDRARNLARAGELDAAIALLEAVAASPALRPLALRTLAPVLRARGDLDASLRAGAELLALTAEDAARRALAETLLAAARPEEALDMLADAAPGAPSVALRARALTQLGRSAEARRRLDAFAHEAGERAWVRDQRAQLALALGPLADGEEELRALLAEAPDDARLESALGYHLALWGRPGQHAEARRRLAAAAGAAPDDADVASRAGWGAFRLGDAETAVAQLEGALRSQPERLQDQARLGLALEALGEEARARSLLAAAVARAPGAAWAEDARAALAELGPGPAPVRDHEPAWITSARTLADEGRIEEGLALLEALAMRAELRPRALEAQAALLQAALDAEPGHDAVRLRLAGVQAERGRPAEALAHYDALIARGAADAALHVDRGAALARLGEREAAARAYREALAADPALPEAHLNLALLALEEGDADAAVAHLERAIELRPDYAKAHLLLARVLAERDAARAATHAERALATEPGAPAD